MFKNGDKVRRKNGQTFSNGDTVKTVDKVESFSNGCRRVWFKSGTHIDAESLELVPNEVEVVKEKVKELIKQKTGQLKSIEDDIKKLTYTLVTLDDLNER